MPRACSWRAGVTRSLNIWKFPVDGDALGNVSRGVQITRQTGQVQTPSVGASDREVVPLGQRRSRESLGDRHDNRGEPSAHLRAGSRRRPGSAGLVAGRAQIAFYATRAGVGWNWLVNPDGGNPRQFTAGGWASWSRDGRWLYLNGNTPGGPTGALGPLKKFGPRQARACRFATTRAIARRSRPTAPHSTSWSSGLR